MEGCNGGGPSTTHTAHAASDEEIHCSFTLSLYRVLAIASRRWDSLNFSHTMSLQSANRQHAEYSWLLPRLKRQKALRYVVSLDLVIYMFCDFSQRFYVAANVSTELCYSCFSANSRSTVPLPWWWHDGSDMTADNWNLGAEFLIVECLVSLRT